MKFNLQLFGGRSGRSGLQRASAEERALAAITSRREVTAESPITAREMLDEMYRQSTQTQIDADLDRYVLKQISQARFTEEGNGNWQMNIDGIGGGQVLDETGSTRALHYGNMPDQKTYSATAWIEDTRGNLSMVQLGMFDRRSEAQNAIKDALRGNRRNR